MSFISEKSMTMARRKALPKSRFVFPEKAPGHGSFPLGSEKQARSALSRGAAKGPAVEKKVRAKVHRLYPGIEQSKKSESVLASRLVDELLG